MKHLIHTNKDTTFYMDDHGYEALKVNHKAGNFVTLQGNMHTLSLSRFHREMVEHHGLQCYDDITIKEYMDRASDKQLKRQGLKRI